MLEKTEDRRQKTEDRRQRTEDREQRTENRGQKTEKMENNKYILMTVALSLLIACI